MLTRFIQFMPILTVISLSTGVATADMTPRGEPLLIPPPPARTPPQPESVALSAAKRGDWEKAQQFALRAGPGADTLLHAIKLLSGAGTPAEFVVFSHAHPTWPDLDVMRLKTETTIVDASPEDIFAFFEDAPPQTGLGALTYARAARALGKEGDAQATLIMAWLTFDLTTDEHNAFMADYSELLAPYHDQRLDMALWRGLRDVELMLPLASTGMQDKARVRQAFAAGAENAEELLEALDPAAQQDAGIAHARFNRMIKSDQAEEAIALILAQSKREDGLGDPDRWAGWRKYLARELMQDRDAVRAYEMAALHQLSEGSNFADLEWLAGYIALTYLDDPKVALRHFNALLRKVATPISVGRAWYWIGRSHEALKDTTAARAAYVAGSAYQSSYYGLLAAEKAGAPFELDSTPLTKPVAQSADDLRDDPLYRAAELARHAGQINLSRKLLHALADRLPSSDVVRLSALLNSATAPFDQVKLGKYLAGNGRVISEHYYPMHPLSELSLPVPTELSLAIARRESEFNTGALSHAGAEGLMQLMPGTSRDVAKAIGIAYQPKLLRSDWAYNARLGSAYLAELAERFDGNVVMIAAGYNAGPGRPIQWIKRFGDPRTGHEGQGNSHDIVDWIEHIPFNETRNYVMRVTESLPVYRARLGKDPFPVPFSAELAGSTIVAKTLKVD